MNEENKRINILRRDYGGLSESEYNRLQKQFKCDLVFAYNKKVNEIVSVINNRASNDKDKLWLLFDYFTKEDMKYDLNRVHSNGLVSHPGYTFSNYELFKVSQVEKYPAVLFNKGVCITFSKAFEDICNNKLNIPCRIVNGYTGLQHAWNIVLLDGEVKHIDVAYALINRNRIDKRNFFLQSLDDIKNISGDRTVESNIFELKEEMLEQYKNIHPQIRIIPKISILNDNDSKKGRRI